MTPIPTAARPDALPEPDAPTRILGPSDRRPLLPIDTSLTRDTRLPYFAGYEVLGELGRGGMGIVYKARQTALNRVVALKVVLGGAFADDDRLDRFRREAEAVARLQHPAIVQIFEVGVRHGLTGDGLFGPYICLEFVEGGSLARRLDGRPQPARDSARLVETLARAVHYAHERGIVHRDLKPANVLLTPDGAPKLTDFGLAKELGSDRDVKTATGLAMGTPEYMSPEQAAGHGVGPAADVYALGVILYEMLTGRPPFEGENALTVLDQLLREPPRPPRRLRAELPRDLEVVCLKCLAKEPGQRYASAAALADDLARFQADEPIHARPQGSAERLSRWCRRKPLLAGMTAALITVFLLGFVGVTAMWLVADARGRLAEQKSNEASDARDREARARADGQLHIARLDGVTASQMLEDGDLLAALPWLVEMMQLEEQGLVGQPAEWAAKSRIHRTRLAAVLRQCPRPIHVWTHDKPLRTAFFSRDGRKVITATRRGAFRSWDTETGAMGIDLQSGPSDPNAFAQGPGGLLVASAFRDIDVAFLDEATGEHVRQFLSLEGVVRQVAISSDGRRLLVGYANWVRVWSLSPWRELWEAVPPYGDPSGVVAAAFTADGKKVIVAGCAGTPQLRDAETGKVVKELVGPKGSTTTVCSSPDSRFVATGGPDGAYLWNAETGDKIKALSHETGVWNVAFSPDSRVLATAGGDGTARIWDAATGHGPLATVRHAGRVVRVVFSPDGRRLLTASHDGSARMWDAATGRALLPPLRHTRPLITAAFHPDGDRVLTAADDGVVRLWDVTEASHPARALPHAGSVQHATFDRDGGRVATAAIDGTVRVWGIDGSPASPWMRQSERLLHVGFHPGGRALLTAGYRPSGGRGLGVVQSWDLDRSAPGDIQLVVGAGRVTRAQYSPDGSRVLLVGPYTANVWDRALNKDIVVINHGNFLRCAAFSPDGSRVALGTHVGFGAWESASGADYRVEHSDVSHVAFSPDGLRIVVAGSNHAAGVFDALNGKPLTGPLSHDGPVRHVAFSPDGRVLVSVADDRTARLWDAATGNPLLPPLQHRGPVIVAAFSPDGRELLTVCNVPADRGSEGRVRWWDVATGEPLTPPLSHPGALFHAAVSPRGGLVVAACESGSAWLWPTAESEARPADDLRQLAELLSGQRLDKRFGPVALSHDELEARLRELRSRCPDQFRMSPDRVAAWRRYEAAECESAGHWAAAAWYLDRLLADRPTDWELIARRAHVYFSSDSSDRAASLLDEAARHGPPAEVRAWVKGRADLLAAAGKWKSALWYLDRLMADRATDAALYVERASIRGHLNDMTGRTADLAKAVELGAGGGVVAALADVRAAEGKWAEAARLFALAAERGVPRWGFHAIACLKAGDIDGYRKICSACLAWASKSEGRIDQINEAAWICVLMPGATNDYAQAIEFAERVVKDSPSELRHGFLNTLGAVLHRAGRHREAITRLREGLSLGDATTEDWIFLGLAHHALGETKEAAACLEKVRAALPSGGGAFSWNRVECDFLRVQLEAALAAPRRD